MDEPYGVTMLPVSADLERRYFEIMDKDARGEVITEADMQVVIEYSDNCPAEMIPGLNLDGE